MPNRWSFVGRSGAEWKRCDSAREWDLDCWGRTPEVLTDDMTSLGDDGQDYGMFEELSSEMEMLRRYCSEHLGAEVYAGEESWK